MTNNNAIPDHLVNRREAWVCPFCSLRLSGYPEEALVTAPATPFSNEPKGTTVEHVTVEERRLVCVPVSEVEDQVCAGCGSRAGTKRFKVEVRGPAMVGVVEMRGPGEWDVPVTELEAFLEEWAAGGAEDEVLSTPEIEQRVWVARVLCEKVFRGLDHSTEAKFLGVGVGLRGGW